MLASSWMRAKVPVTPPLPPPLVSDTCNPPPFVASLVQRAVDAVLRLPPSEARDGLVNICHIVLTRNK